MFVRRWYSSGEISIDLDQVDWAPYVFVLGSCVSRDMFEFSKVPLAGYRARSSFGSIASPPIDVDEDRLDKNQSEFQRRMVRGDLEKSNVGLVRRSPGRAVLVDFIDERLPLKRDDGYFYTDSPELRATALELGGTGLDPYSNEYYEKFEEGWKIFDQGVRDKTILVNRVYWAQSKEDGSVFANIDEIERQNEKLDRLYEIIERISPRVLFVGPFDDQLVSSVSHRWGENPYHYCDALYENVARDIESILRLNQA